MDATLEQRLKTLMGVRLVMVTTLLLVAVYVEAAYEYLLPFNPFYLIIAATYALTVLHALALRFVPNQQALVYAQVVGDLLIVTGLVYLTGGSRTGFVLLYPTAVLTASVMLTRAGAMALAAFAMVLYGALLTAVRYGRIPPQGLSDIPFMTPSALLYSIFVTGVACATVALIGSYLSTSLRSASEQLVEAAGQVADLQKLNEMIVSSMHSGLLITDSGGRILYVNDYGVSILGRRAADIRGLPAREVLGSRRLELELQASATPQSRLDLEYSRPDGERLDLGVSVSPLATSEGGHLLVFQDLTEIKRLEREVRSKEKLAAVGEMAAQLAHEIRNPLGSISGSAQVLLGDADVSEEQRRLLDIIHRESKRLSDSLNQFLFQARASPPPSEPVDLGPILTEAVTLLRNAPEVSGYHRVDFEIDGGPHLCVAHPDKVAQVFWNLARNALEAMPDGGRLLIRLYRRAEEVVLTVRDEGRGMAQHDQYKMFEPFRSGTSMGTGLGLAIVYRIVREHRGDISVRSVPGKGTEFEVHLPLALVPVSA
jgi:two-component system sensor histidine kinase PilS (NtrC family)